MNFDQTIFNFVIDVMKTYYNELNDDIISQAKKECEELKIAEPTTKAVFYSAIISKHISLSTVAFC